MTIEVLQYDFMQRALLAALLVGVTAPCVGIYLIQRRLTLIGDGMGHVALTGVALGLLAGRAPVWTALVTAVAGAIVIELIRAHGRTGGDVAVALLFYGGIAGGVVIVSQAPDGTPSNLTAYLFGAITTTSSSDLWVFAALSAVILLVAVGMAPRLFAVSNDEEYARASGVNVLGYNLLLAVLTATTVVVAMRVVGLLLISALMIVPTATAQLVSRSFRGTLVLAMLLGVVPSLAGVFTSFYADTPSGGTIVLFALALFLLVACFVAARTWWVRRRHLPTDESHPHEHGENCGHEALQHGSHVDYLHGGHRHAVHGTHYDEH